MRPKERRDSGTERSSALAAGRDHRHGPSAGEAGADDRLVVPRAERFGAVYKDKPGRPPLPTRLMAGLAILKHTYDLSDEVLCERWVENPYYQFFCGEEFFQHRLVFDRSSLTRWRQRMGEEQLRPCCRRASRSPPRPRRSSRPISTASSSTPRCSPRTSCSRPMPGFSTAPARSWCGSPSEHGVKLRQSYARVGKFALIKHQRYAHAKQFKTRQQGLEEAQNLSRPHHPRHRPQDRWQCRLAWWSSTACWRWPAVRDQSSASAGRRSTRCTRPRWNASARARRTGLTSSASRSPSPPRYRTPRAVSSSPM